MFGVRSVKALLRGFPQGLKGDVLRVLAKTFIRGAWPAGRIVDTEDDPATVNGYSPCSWWTLRGGETIRVPYRVGLRDNIDRPDEIFTPSQVVVYHCLLSRSWDGYVRERHIKALLGMVPPDWTVPYVVKICDEYVLGILDFVYRTLSGSDTSAYREICALNSRQFARSHRRMVSYWNEYHRRTKRACYLYGDYVGKKLFEECFGYDRSMERQAKAPS